MLSLPTNYYIIIISQGLKFGTPFAMVALGYVGVYATYTLLITQWRTKFRIYMNQAENEAGNKAIDSLINYETVKVRKILSSNFSVKICIDTRVVKTHTKKQYV